MIFFLQCILDIYLVYTKGMIRKIISLGKYSAVVSLPKEMMKKLGWKRGQKVEVSSERNKIEIKDY